MAINKVIYGNTTLMDLTSDTATEDKVMSGYTFHDASGTLRTGTASGTGGWMPHLIIYTETNSTVVIEKGQTSITATETSTGVFEADLPEYDYGIYTITITCRQNVKIIELDVDTVQVYELTVSFVPNGSTVTPTDDIQIWLACAEIIDKSYTTLAEVLADTDTYQLLLANSNACDYMARSTSWALAEGLVPAMTSDTTPSGVCSASSVHQSGYEAYRGFDKNETTAWHSIAGVPQWLEYQFTSDVNVKRVTLKTTTTAGGPKTSKIQYYDGSEWKDYSDDASFVDCSTLGTTYSKIYNTNISASRFRLYVTESNYTYQGNQYVILTELQFYADVDITTNQDAMRLLGKYDYACDLLLNDATWKDAICSSDYFEYILSTKVPNMTSDNAPSGTVYSNSDYGFGAWKAFNGVLGTTNDNNRWVSKPSKYGTEAYLSYDFGESVYIAKAQIYAVLSGGSENPVAATLYIEGSNDDSSWTPIISKAMTTTEMSQYTNIDLDYASYRYYRAYFSQCNMRGSGSDYYSQIRILQLYGRHESNYVSGKVAIHGARSSSLYYKSGGSDVIVGTTDIDTGIASVNVSNMPLGTYALYDGVAKKPSDLTVDYSKTVTITQNTTDVWLMPDNTLYWWGYESDNLEDMSTANGWVASGITYITPTRNTNDIYLNTSTTNQLTGIGTKNVITASTIKSIITGISYYNNMYGQMCRVTTKTNSASDVANIDTNTAKLYTYQGSDNIYTFIAGWKSPQGTASSKVQAFWYE